MGESPLGLGKSLAWAELGLKAASRRKGLCGEVSRGEVSRGEMSRGEMSWEEAASEEGPS
jgi:hypothetical protein